MDNGNGCQPVNNDNCGQPVNDIAVVIAASIFENLLDCFGLEQSCIVLAFSVHSILACTSSWNMSACRLKGGSNWC